MSRRLLFSGLMVVGLGGLDLAQPSTSIASSFECPIAECVGGCPIDYEGMIVQCRAWGCETTTVNCMVFGACSSGMLYCGSPP